MKLIKEEKFEQNISEKFDYSFETESVGLYLIEITAHCKNWQQNWQRLFDDDDLRIETNHRPFPKLKKRGLFNSPAAFNGNRLKNLSQANFYLIKLNQGQNIISFIPGQKPYLKELKIYQIISQKFSLEIQRQAEGGHQRPWMSLAIKDVPLKQIKISASAGIYQDSKDDDDLQIRIDGQREINPTSKAHQYWYWCGRVLKGKTEIFEKEVNFEQGLHYVELWADRRPRLEEIKFELEEIPKTKFIKGQISLYEDIVAGVEKVNLRSQPIEESDILIEISNKEKIIILEKAVLGDRPKGFLSDLWHRVLYKGKKGFIHSSFIEIEGQEREKVIEKIKIKAKELDIDENLALNLAHCESKWLPFAHSETDNKGIYQLGVDTIKEINEKHKGNIIDPYNIEQNIDGGLKYFRYLLDKYNGSSDYLRRVITAWSRGPERISYDEPFVFEKQSEGAQILIRCVLEEKRGAKYLKIFGLFLLIFLVGLAVFSFIIDENKKVEDWQKERSVYMSRDYIASFLERAKKEEVILTDFKDDFNGDSIFEKVTFGFFSPEAFYYITRVHSPSNKVIDVYGEFSKAETRDLNNDGIKELTLSVISGRMFNFFIFGYEKGELRLLPTYNQSPDYYDGIWARFPIEFQDIDNDGMIELLAKTESFPSGNWRDWYEIIEYYRWNGIGFEKYGEEKKFYDDPCKGKASPCAAG